MSHDPPIHLVDRNVTAERTFHKLAERAKRGKWNGGWVPIGYKYEKATK